mmetsp:Transcript_26456/g.41940  ORF Transcript_26456/g.41940 Transcript_26456/m.41940 type:complete len:354 (+) Transcript_26456:41-1102(+)|eukprot:CAMPEP_0197023570 /NCGR_PEP_ID=MMETSP1384-20130603/4241_1 /TAXON_ID=29189 /ORGANISM="Ammonia sp." /LENGTH=353 /DNA_ID=CAMNT_0042451801 /DNA_START=20 /DNA_END=1081 /DNA_ORIENTATION=-
MGAEQSNPESTGWRILEVIPNGPCWDKGLCVYFDFIVGINGVRLTTSSEEFWDTIKSKQDTEIILTVFNYKTRIKRDVAMTPNTKWDGDGLLGLVIVREDFTKCDEQCIRVLSVDENSPASAAGLQPQTDYILGTPINAFTSFSIFRDTISDYIDQPLPVYVYNSEQAAVRLVEITPSSQWQGDGVLGCQVGDGYLHHIPSLTEKQSDIQFIPNVCYTVSSKKRPPQHQQEYHSSNPNKPAPQKHAPQQEPEQQQQDENVNTANTAQGDATEDNVDSKDNEQVNDDELPKIRWTDSSHRLPMKGADDEDAEQPQEQEEEIQHAHYQEDMKDAHQQSPTNQVHQVETQESLETQ